MKNLLLGITTMLGLLLTLNDSGNMTANILGIVILAVNYKAITKTFNDNEETK